MHSDNSLPQPSVSPFHTLLPVPLSDLWLLLLLLFLTHLVKKRDILLTIGLRLSIVCPVDT